MNLRNALSDISFMNTLFTSAERAAHDLGDEVMGAEHLVIAALENDDLDRSDLEPLALDGEKFRAAIVAVHAEALDALGIEGTTSPIAEPPHGALHSTHTAQEVFQDARKSAKARKVPLSAAGILVAAAARLEHGTTARALAHLGIDRSAIEALERP